MKTTLQLLSHNLCGVLRTSIAGDVRNHRSRVSGPALALVMIFTGALCCPSLGQAVADSQQAGSPQSLLASPLSLADSVNIALRQSPSVLRAEKDLRAAQGIAIQTRAVVLPRIAATGNYNAVEASDLDQLRAPGVTFGNRQNWATQLKLVQSIYEGGRMLSGLRSEKLVRQQSLLNYQAAVADTVLAVQIAYYDVLVALEQIAVEEASLELLTQELADTNRRFSAGTVPQFNVLRAEVELANARPRLIRARNSLRVSKNNFANVLGITVPRETLEDIPLKLTDKLEDTRYDVTLQDAIAAALERRPELSALGKGRELRREEVVTAKAAYRPSLQGYAGYDVHNSMLSQDLTVERHGWIAGAQLTWNIFDGRRAHGRVIETSANFEKAGVELDDAGRRVELEVRTAYSNFIEAREVIESQKKAVEAALEAVRLAQARAEAGSGTQLDVLDAQTALTQSRTTAVQSLHQYDVARARLQHAMGVHANSAAQQQSAH